MKESARGRLFEAMLLALAERGYQEIALENVLERSGVTADEFDAEFADIDACLFAAYEHLTQDLSSATTEQCRSGGSWPERVRLGLEALLEEFAARPEMALALTHSFPAIRPAAHARYMAFLETFAPMLREGRDCAEETLPAEVEMLAIGAAETIVFEKIETGRAADLPALAPAVLFSVLVPFLGPEDAHAAMRDASQGAAP